MSMRMDETDSQIIALLSRDGRTNNNEIAKKLGISEGTVRNRIKKLVESGVLRVTGLVSPDTIQDRQLFLLGVNIAASRDLTTKAQEIVDLPNVKSVSITTGRYDLIVEVWTDAKYGMIQFISEEMAKIDGIISTESFLTMKNYNKWINP